MKEPVKVSKDKALNNLNIEYDCRLKKRKNKWYLCIPYKVKVDETRPRMNCCACDPGVRKFQTIYSEQQTTKIAIRKERMNKLLTAG